MAEPVFHRHSFFLSAEFAYLLYFVLALLLLPVYHLQLNPDAISYLTIASEYWHHLIPDAINGAFSPLYSWLLAPLLGMGLGGPLAARLLAVPIGAGVIYTADRLAVRLSMADDMRRALRLALVLPILSLGFIVITPDLLATWITLIYLLLICSPDYLRRPRMWVGAGMIGALMYLAKAYAMWFFLGHFIAVHLVWIFQKTERRRIIAAMMVGLCLFILIAAPWVTALSWKYGHFAINTTGKYNHAIEAPDALVFPPTEMGLLVPPTAQAVSIWQDPSTINLPDWNEWGSAANFKHFLLVIARNIGDCAEEMCCYSLLLPAIALIAGVAMIGTRCNGASALITLAALLYPLGYLLRHIEQRFVSAPAILLILLGGLLIDRASRTYAIPRMHRNLGLWILCLSLLPNPIWNLIRYSGHEGQRLREVGERISQFVPKHANVASDSDWFTSMYASYYAQLRYYGVLRPHEPAEEFEQELEKQRVQYLLIWGEQQFPNVLGWQRVTPSNATLPAIFKVRQ